MTTAQEGLWLAYNNAPQHTLYNLTLKFTFSHDANKDYDCTLEAIHKAVNVLTARHAILRSTFHSAGKSHPRPFVAEHDVKSATPILVVVPEPNTVHAEGKVLNILRNGVDLSSNFAVRWIAVVGTNQTELYLVAHHIALDGTSMARLSAEFFGLLVTPTSESSVVASTAPQMPFCHAHMFEVSASFANSSDFDAAQKFWKGQLTHVRPLKWTVTPPPAAKSFREIQSWFDLSKSELAAWGNRYRTSWFRVAVALVGVLAASRAAPKHGSDHPVTIAFGGRPAGMDSSIGHFANAMPIRIPMTEALNSGSIGALSFETLVKLVSKEISAAKKHERFSFLNLSRAQNQDALEVPRAQVAVTLSPKLSRSECCLYPVEGPYDLFFCFLEGADGVSLGLIYNPAVFSESDIADLKTDFVSLRALTLAETPLDVASLPAINTQVPRLLPSLDLSNVEEISSSRFHVWFEHQAAQNPGLIAMQSGEQGTSVTYRELNERANRIAHYLRSLGATRGALVLLHICRSFSTMVWIMGVLKSGAAYAVADQSHPVERTRAVLSVAQPTLVVDDGQGRDIKELVAEFGIELLDAGRLPLDDMPADNLDDCTENDDLAYIVFTSGSTGKPKGVEIEHRNLSHFVANAYSSRYLSMGPGSRILQFATFAFDAAVLEWSQCLAVGGTLCFADHPKMLVGDYLADVIDANEISIMHLTPSVLATLPTSRPLPSLRQISVGGEMVPENLIKAWRSRVQVQNAYGPTECTVVMSHQPQPSAPEAQQPPANIIGAPHQHMKFYVFNDKFDRALPVGEIGEVCIGGPQVGRGYKGRDDLTASRFAVHPDLGERVYRTGDRGKLLSNGSVSLIGRIDREVKIRGYRIELDDVERTISGLMPEIVGVSVHPDKSGASLCAFVAPSHIDGNLVKARLAECLPSYMIPSAVYSLQRLPSNTNDKIDHSKIGASMDTLIAEARQKVAFKHDSPPTPPASSGYRTPATRSSSPPVAAISRIAQIWETVLDLSRPPSASDNFFDLGGNSLTISKLSELLNKEFPGTSARVIDLFARPTVQAQAGLYDTGNSEPSRSASPSPEESDYEDDALPAIADLETASQKEDVLIQMTDIWTNVLGTQPSVQTNFFDAGGHSVAVAQVHQAIRAKWPSANIKIVDLFHHSTIQSQAALVLKSQPGLSAQPKIPVSRSSRPRAAAKVTPSPPTQNSEIAIVGIAGRFPGATTPEELYQLFIDRKEGLSSFPEDARLPFDGAIYVARKGALSGVQDFDPAFWGLKDDEARNMDPQQRLFMDTTLEALEDAGHVPSPQGRNSIGLCVGAAENTWQQATETVHGDEFYRVHRSALTPPISARTAYHLNLHGPNLTLNTACSSGLVAMSVAVDQLRSGQCDISVAGAVTISFPQEGYVTAKGQLFSPSGHCRPFDHRADGTLPADAVCALVLRRLDDAVRDGDKIYSVISGMATGSDGSTDKAGCTVPSPRGQAETIKRAWKDASIPASKLVYAELHGSGTPIGDALELEALHLARSEMGADKAPCVVGSNKGNLGNTEAASGLVSVIKLCKSMQHGVIPPIQSFEKLSPLIDSDPSVVIASAETRISDDAVVCVSSAGLGGVNAHCVMRFPPTSSRRRPEDVYIHTRRNNTRTLVSPPSRQQVNETPAVNVCSVIQLCASRILEADIQEDTDLRYAGLDSNGQIRLMRQVSDVLPSASLRLSAFSSSPCTPASLAATIEGKEHRQASQSLPSYMTVVRSGSPSVIYALIAPGGGSCGSYVGLSQHLPTSATIVTVEHPNFRGRASMAYNVQDLAQLYARDLTQSFGSMSECVLVGASFGGVVAWDLSQRLAQMGVVVKSIALLDSPWPGPSSSPQALTASAFLQNVFSITSSTDASSEPESSDTSEVGRLLSAVGLALSTGPPAEQAEVHKHDWQTMLALYVEAVLAVRAYSLDDSSKLDIPCVYVKASHSEVSDRCEQWGKILPRLSIGDVDAEHASVCKGKNGEDVAKFIADTLL
ncbi:hypothetical protein FIBSPDRAFT_798902 [Athelia psychrophila]|uniref:Uncharacterized protein n=1 Tax=Athelia psychrophila TaxID=1759441 RepID=A0A166B9N4_9AGAM|nr:hypothetical protein FIBSPDRAFT_798902 [Fibularhizoctonia sp. CBS 109695]